MSTLTTLVQILFPLLVAGVVFVMPVWLLVSGIARLRRKQGGKIRVLIGMAMALFAIFVLDSFLGPWHEKILAKGTAPDGREFALLQVGGGEPFEIRLYVRSEEAGWVFHYVDHEVFPWRSGGHVEFSPDTSTATIFHGSEVFKIIEIVPKDQPESESFSPSDTPEDILRRITNR